MGLDMYLEAEKYFNGCDWESDEVKAERQKIVDIIPEIYESGNLNSITVSFEAGYWRKANQIHNWFVKNCQDGQDDCRRSYVGRDDLEKLRDMCKEVLEKSVVVDGTIRNGYTFREDGSKKYDMEAGKVIQNKEVAEKLLPTQEGFFFGGTDYDEFYLEDLKRTVEIIDRALKLSNDWEFYYHSSW